MTSPSYPIVRLRPNANARAIRHGFPWVYANELVLDRRSKSLAPGSLAVLEDADRTPMGLVTVNPNSKIICRMLDRDPEEEINAAWFGARLQRALAHRARLYGDTQAHRLVHAEADGMPGVVIDRFNDVFVIQPNAAWADTHFDALVAAIEAASPNPTIVKNGTGRARKLEGLEETLEVARGDVAGPVGVEMNGATYFADVLEGQKTGLFFDQRENHAFAARLAVNARVLDVFSHVGGFGLAALANGAAGVLSVDSSEPALELAQRGAAAMGLAPSFTTRRGDAFKVMEALAEEGETFDVVICDPPAFAPSKDALERGLRAYERVARMATALVRPGGYLGLCSCSHAAELSKFRNASARGIGRAGRRGQIIHTGFAGPDHPQMPQLAESGYLKAVFFRLDG
ncbi:LSU m5C1962 methyltransferase RlmI [Candidatus Rhodobacter oscarellae]|uniref:LSU m5C1962 methyltransferase RlmI n=1 Tax=Candidatus Rhodobacter oscarellae TaxID=1675527 RepID=A0A0J9E1Y6_9RHOB|nr:class I SAM-dependent rRNA methyltransferase [Candidatus Rhodobacter lobularis]KMW56712.1 LSU m5C1962 methyltransferase RlmI [Candidatus Rhodobacter lobularis]